MQPYGASLASVASAASGEAAARAASTAPGNPDRIHEAARQFEGLLLQQILRAGRAEGEGWMGTGSDSAGECATGFAEQQFAAALAARGGLGLAHMISAGLECRKAPAAVTAAQSAAAPLGSPAASPAAAPSATH